VSWPDWLGNPDWRSFEDARAFARRLKLKSQKGWQSYCRSGKKPDDIPSEPNTVYAASWVSLRDWLGAGRRMGGWRSFEDARAFVRRLKLKSQGDWQSYCKNGKKPDDIPAKPARTYAGAGWMSWPDWLGYERRHKLRKKLALTKS